MVRAGTAIVAALRDDVDRLLAAEPDVRADAWDSVHQMRVATRRLRSVLRSYRTLFEATPIAEMQDELKWLADLLGVARDAEVRAERFAALLAAHAPQDEFARLATESAVPKAGSAYVPGTTEYVRTDLVDAERDRYRKAHAEILDALDHHRYHALRHRLSSWRTDPPLDADTSKQPADEVFERILRKDRKRLQRMVYAEPAVSPAERVELLHDIRKGAKRLRYSCEGATDVLGSAAKDLGTEAKRLQTVLGDHRDAVESREAILARAARTHATGVNATIYELLADAEEIAAGEALAKYPAAAAFVSG
ncbi:CHAD domain-containing protein [Nocardia pseudovaccinii]|uniref:CHAD domain-containing protein n=1 Tax=Nocardia pseudovaccinii TaxID=189540 RepID=UPI0007A54C5D|nr:CHAD domain-containing protein [Nocardia pseudovaccinii]